MTKDLNRSIDLAFAKTGIVALVDEATGYQDERPADALVKLFSGYIDEALRPWFACIPTRFWRDLFRVVGIGVWLRGQDVGLVNPHELVDRAEELVEMVRGVVFDAISEAEAVSMKLCRPKPRDAALDAALRAAGLDELIDSGNRSFDYRVIAVGALLRVARGRGEFEEFVKVLDGKKEEQSP